MKIYKIWVYVEEIDEEEDHYEDVTLPLCAGIFADQDRATQAAYSLEYIFADETEESHDPAV